MKVNLNLLKRLYLIDHHSKEENDMISFILNYCYKIPKLTFYLDHYNNLFITKNTTNPEYYPCVVAHMDTIQTFTKPRELYINKGIIKSRYISTHEPCGLNADDCNGILVALQLLETLPNLKVCFTVEEEIGGNGAEEAANNYEFFSDVIYLIQADRRGANDLIIHTNGIECASSQFVKDIKPLCDKYYYVEDWGTFTDVGVLAENLELSGVNVSCGYYHEHTVNECCNIAELENCLNFIHDIIISLKDKKTAYTITVPKSKYGSYRDYYDYYYNGHDVDTPPDEYDEDLPCNHCKTQDCMHCTKVTCY